MAVTTAVDFKAEAKKLFKHFDHQEFEELKGMFADDGQGVDEISRGWLRGKNSLDKYFKKLQDMGVADIHSKLRDFSVKEWKETALVTCVTEQTYRAGGEQVSITAPVSILYQRNGAQWKIALIHAVALPEMG